MPPSTGTMAPVTYDAAGDSRNAPTRPISADVPVAAERDRRLVRRAISSGVTPAASARRPSR